MAFNFWESSLLKVHISNYLLITLDNESCDILSKKGIACYVYAHDPDAKTAVHYGTRSFLRKVFIKTSMVSEALNLGYRVLLTDVDVVFLSNPLDNIKCDLDACDIALQWDRIGYNSGFLLVNPTQKGKDLYAATKDMGETIMDQNALNDQIKVFKTNHSLNAQRLNSSKFPCGWEFWEHGKRMFADGRPCPECIAIHNNWITTMAAKTYRFREMHMWHFDSFDHYYTDPCRKYLIYGNLYGNASVEMELDALKNALAIGKILKRTVILPRFHFGNPAREFSIISSLRLITFQKHFPNYRENVFLSHPKVPKAVRKSLSDFHEIHCNISRNLHPKRQVITHFPANISKGATEKEIRDWFGKEHASVLRFISLYHAFCCFDKRAQNNAFQKKVAIAVKGFKRLRYVQ